ncbi:MAG: hypothetical protein ACRDD3_03005 [Azovibrio sp.]
MQVEQLNPPVLGKASLLDKEFGAWWVVLNSLGVFSFGMFLACLGLNEHKHNCAVLCLLFVLWFYWAVHKKFPLFVSRLRAKKTSGAAALEKEIWAGYFPFLKSFVTHFPMWLGLSSLLSLALYLLFLGQWNRYVYIIS